MDQEPSAEAKGQAEGTKPYSRPCQRLIPLGWIFRIPNLNIWTHIISLFNAKFDSN